MADLLLSLALRRAIFNSLSLILTIHVFSLLGSTLPYRRSSPFLTLSVIRREFRGARFQQDDTEDADYPELTVLQDFVCDANPDLMFYIVDDTIFIHLPRPAQR